MHPRSFFPLTSVAERILLGLSLLLSFCLFLYSYTQVDLGLTITRNQTIFQIERAFQTIGYFNRPLSTLLYTLLLFSFFAIYIYALVAIRKKQVRPIFLAGLIILISIILTFSYNAFSYDLFNYIFDAKIVTFYHQNPYLMRALDFPHDPMLGFMHWTHRLYPYGPIWLLVTIPLSFLGMHYFVVTFFLFKFLMAGCFLGTCFLLYIMSNEMHPQRALFGVALFALNPLVLIESLVSAHNDIVMMLLLVGGLFCLLRKRYYVFILFFILSIGIKFATILLLPIFILFALVLRRRELLPWGMIWLLSLILMYAAVLLAANRTNFQPWYLLLVMPFVTLLVEKKWVMVPAVILTFIALTIYIPFFYLGDWNNFLPTLLQNISLIGIGIAMILSAIGIGIVYKQECLGLGKFFFGKFNMGHQK